MVEQYVEIKHAVPSDVELAVLAAMRHGMRQLGIRRPIKYAFFVPGYADDWHAHRFASVCDVGGVTFDFEPDKIWIRADVTPREAAAVALHELVHTTHIEIPGFDADKWERHAQRFAARQFPMLERSLTR